ncbi:MAG: hypothetical protein HY741_00940 [Chloroflexi bacterium]|nr:hypothetical protein [Chloroflexota bacterium]
MPLLRVSHRSQLQRADCLAACAAMVLDYLGVFANYQELLGLLQVGEYGTAYSNLPYLAELERIPN